MRYQVCYTATYGRASILCWGPIFDTRSAAERAATELATVKANSSIHINAVHKKDETL